MGVTGLEEDRFFPRYMGVTPAFPGTLLLRGEAVAAVVTDVSRDGLGVVSPIVVGKGDELVLDFAGKRVALTVAYCTADLIHPGKLRWGLQRVGTAENLVNLFRAGGFLLER